MFISDRPDRFEAQYERQHLPPSIPDLEFRNCRMHPMRRQRVDRDREVARSGEDPPRTRRRQDFGRIRRRSEQTRERWKILPRTHDTARVSDIVMICLWMIYYYWHIMLATSNSYRFSHAQLCATCPLPMSFKIPTVSKHSSGLWWSRSQCHIIQIMAGSWGVYTRLILILRAKISGLLYKCCQIYRSIRCICVWILSWNVFLSEDRNSL